jgi:hypothetical protein
MAVMPDGTEPIDPDERIYRRVVDKSNFYNATRDPPLSQKAFNPTKDDKDGISVTRASYVSGPEEAASRGFHGKRYYIIEMRAGDLQGEGLILKPDLTPVISGMPSFQRSTPQMPQANLFRK